jgi:Protein of unknown function (DUF1573)/Abnormal spindle-like microcephaly-assoc'd, ASPM-SPD-2-Hydin/Beta-propeller repeat
VFHFARYSCVLMLFLASIPAFSAPEPMNQALPITFEANRGQVPGQYGYAFHRDGIRVGFFRNAVDFAFAGDARLERGIGITLLGADAEPIGRYPLAGQANYFLGNDSKRWIRKVPLYSTVEYRNLYRGISLSFYGNGRELEHDFEVEAGADPSQIAFRVHGAKSVELVRDGDLLIQSEVGSLRLRRPVAYQTTETGRQAVDATFIVAKDGTVQFSVGSYDHKRSLVIDPVFVFATYLGGTGTDVITAVTTDANENIVVTGYTSSTDFPTKSPEQPAIGGCQSGDYGCQNAFITKLDPTGKTLIYSTYLGGSYQDFGGAIAVDSSGNAIVAGTTLSTDFPHAGAIASPTCQFNSACFFLASLTPDGSALNYSGTIGGTEGFNAPQTGGPVTVDASGNAYLAGVTDDPNFQITPGTLSTSVLGYPQEETFVLKVDPTGKLLYSTVIPGNASADPSQAYNNLFVPSGMIVNAAGDTTIAGMAGLGLPTTTGVVAAQFPNAFINVGSPEAGFLLQLNATASAINLASYLPGTDSVAALTVDSNGNLWTTGETSETTLPVSANAYQKAPSVGASSGPISGYILKVNPQVTAVLGATYLDGAGTGQTDESSSFTAIALDSKSNVFVGGMTSSADFPLQNPFVTQLEFTGSIGDMILAEMSPDLSTVEFGSFLSSTDASFGGSSFSGLAIDSSDKLIAAGYTTSRNFPTSVGGFEPQLPPPTSQSTSPLHSFIAKIDLATPAPSVCIDSLNVSFGDVNANTPLSKTIQVTNCGNAPLTISTIASSDPTVVATQSCGTIAAASVCPITLTFTPVSSLATNGTITFSDNAVTIPQMVSFSGQGIAPQIVARSNPLSFGHLIVGTQGPAVSLGIQNGGQATLTISKVSLTGTSFSLVSNACTQPLSSDLSCTIQLMFSPASAGTFTGSVVISSNDPVNPQLMITLTGTGDSSYGAPSIISNSAPTVLLNNGPVTLNLTGTNFYPQSVAQLNGIAQTTTFLNNSDLQVTIAASSLTNLGELPLTVVNPEPGGGTSPSTPVTPYKTLLIDPADIVSVPATGLLYAAIPASATANPNTVIPVNPVTGIPGTPILVGNNPVLLAASSDGAYLYVANATDLTLQRINLQTNTVDRTFPYTPDLSCTSCSTPSATDLRSIPGSPQEVVLAQGFQVSLYNDSGLVNCVPNSFVGDYAPQFDSIAFAGNPLALYAEPFTTVQNPFFTTAAITSSGLQYSEITGTNVGPPGNTGNQVLSDGTLLYTNSGEVWDPSTQTQVGTIPMQADSPGSSIGLDTMLGQVYSVGQQSYGQGSVAIVVSAYGMKAYNLTGSLAFPQISWPSESSLVRWGSDGLAFIGPGVGLTDNEVYLLRSSVVSQQSINATPVLNSISPTSVNEASPSFTLTVNGTGFISTSVIEWNGSALTTSYVSTGQLTATVSSSMLVNNGTAQVNVFNPAPGGGTSAAASFTIATAIPAVTLSASSLDFGNLAQGAMSTAQTVTLTNSGTAPLTITGIATSGNFSSTNTCGASVAVNAMCSIAVVFKPSGTGQSTGSLTINDNAANNPQTVSLSGTGIVAFTIGTPSGGSTSATVSSGGTATYDLSLASSIGYNGTVGLTCSGAPQYATCSISPSSLPLTSGSTGSFTVTVTTGSMQTANAQQKSTIAVAGLGLLSVVSFSWMMRGRRMFLGWFVICLAAALIALGVGGCGGGSGGTPSPAISNTPAGTYTLTLTATTGNVSTTQNLTLVVN